LALLFGLVLAGCATGKYTITYEETEISRAIEQAASDLVFSRQGGIPAGELVSGLSAQFPGLKLPPLIGIIYSQIQFNYQDKTYLIEVTMDDDSLNDVGGTGGAARTAGPNTLVTAIKSAREQIATQVTQ